MWRALLPMGIISTLLILAVELEYALHEMSSPLVVGSVAKPIYGWLQKYGIRSLLNTPCGNRDDCDTFRQNGEDSFHAVQPRRLSKGWPYRRGPVHMETAWRIRRVGCRLCELLLLYVERISRRWSRRGRKEHRILAGEVPHRL